MKHWTEDDFKQWLYGLKDEDSHVAECQECRGEMERLTLERRRTLAPEEVPHDFLAAQRRSIHQRLSEPIHNWFAIRWALPVATLLVVILSVTQHPSKPAATISDEQLFSELATMEQRAEPKAIAPIEKLFEE
jgi:hypothetical protein